MFSTHNSPLCASLSSFVKLAANIFANLAEKPESFFKCWVAKRSASRGVRSSFRNAPLKSSDLGRGAAGILILHVAGVCQSLLFLLRHLRAKRHRDCSQLLARRGAGEQRRRGRAQPCRPLSRGQQTRPAELCQPLLTLHGGEDSSTLDTQTEHCSDNTHGSEAILFFEAPANARNSGHSLVKP